MTPRSCKSCKLASHHHVIVMYSVPDVQFIVNKYKCSELFIHYVREQALEVPKMPILKPINGPNIILPSDIM